MSTISAIIQREVNATCDALLPPTSEWNEKPLRDAISRLIDVERRHCIGKAAVFDIKQAQAEVDEAIQALKREPR